jgi:hypothetical protein
MSTDFTKIQMTSAASSNKVYKSGTTTVDIVALPGAGETFGMAAIGHSFGSGALIAQVSTNGGPTDGTILPWTSNDNRIIQYAYVDDTNLYIICISSDSSGLGAPARTITAYYRLLIP